MKTRLFLYAAAVLLAVSAGCSYFEDDDDDDVVAEEIVVWSQADAGGWHNLAIKSDGTPWRPIIHVEDITRAFLAALHAPRQVVHNQAFNVGVNSENYRIRDLAQIVQETVPDCRVEYAPDAGPDKRTYRVGFSKIASALPEFKPQWNARRGAQELYEAYCRYGLNLDEFEGPKYKRVDHIQQLLESGLLDATLRWNARLSAQET